MTISPINWSNSSNHWSQLGRRRAAVLNLYRQRTPNHKQVGFCWFEGAVSLVTGCFALFETELALDQNPADRAALEVIIEPQRFIYGRL